MKVHAWKRRSQVIQQVDIFRSLTTARLSTFSNIFDGLETLESFEIGERDFEVSRIHRSLGKRIQRI